MTDMRQNALTHTLSTWAWKNEHRANHFWAVSEWDTLFHVFWFFDKIRSLGLESLYPLPKAWGMLGMQ